jgi:hypothetical protein
MTTAFAKKPTPKPSLDAKLIAWARAFHAVLDEMRNPKVDNYDIVTTAIIVSAAEVAATLVTGTDLDSW